eukprot:54422-Eustigmatos_ZCMA.PRE.1
MVSSSQKLLSLSLRRADWVQAGARQPVESAGYACDADGAIRHRSHVPQRHPATEGAEDDCNAVCK